MKYSYTETTGNGVTQTFSFSFVGQGKGYLRSSDIHVYVDDVEVSYTLTGTNQVTLTSIPSLGSNIMIRRIMPKDNTYADFSRGNSFTELKLNNSFLQGLYLYHEFLDGFLENDPYFIKSDVSIEGELAAESAILFGQLDMNGNQIINLSDAENDQDAVPLHQVIAIASQAQGSNYVGEEPPLLVFNGLRWFKPSEAITYVYYCDEDSCQWVQESVQSAEGTLREELADSDSSIIIGGYSVSLLKKEREARQRFAVRQASDGAGWSAIEDSAHEPMGLSSVSVDGSGRLVVNYSIAGDKVGSLIVATDETYSAAGVFVGASVAEDASFISAFGTLGGRVSGSGGTGIIKNEGLSPDFTQVVDIAAGTIVVTHAAVSHTDSVAYPVVTAKYGNSAGELVCVVSSRTGFTLQYKETLKGVITNPSGVPAYTGQNAGVTVSFNTDHFLVTHPAVSTLNKNVTIQEQKASGSPNLYRVGTDMTSTTFKVYIYDLAGTLITSPSSLVRFSFSRDELAPASLPSVTVGTVQRMGVPISFNDLFNPSGNFWVIGDQYFE